MTDPRGPTSSHTAGENASRHRLRWWWPSDAQTTSQPAQSCVRRPTVTKGMADGSAATPAGQLGLEAAQHAACRSHHRPTSALKSSWRTNETINLQRRGRESSAWGTDSTLRRYERNRTDGTTAMWANSGYHISGVLRANRVSAEHTGRSDCTCTILVILGLSWPERENVAVRTRSRTRSGPQCSEHVRNTGTTSQLVVGVRFFSHLFTLRTGRF